MLYCAVLPLFQFSLSSVVMPMEHVTTAQGAKVIDYKSGSKRYLYFQTIVSRL